MKSTPPIQRVPKLIVILGPTASGKSDLAVRIAKKLGGEIISADSRQVYRGLDIGSGKITAREMRGVPHHLLDVASPRGVFSVARYQKLARKALRDIVRRGRVPIIAGGTGFYIDALLYDTSLPAVKPDAKLRAALEKKSAAVLFGELQRKDPARAAAIDRHNKRRLIRALEIIRATGKPVPAAAGTEAGAKQHAAFLSKLGIEPQDVLKIGIAWPAEALRARIHKRLLARMRQGMVAEVRRLHAEGLSWQRLDNLGLEYRSISRFLRGMLSKEEMLALLEKEIWHYARRQMTWWRKDAAIHWLNDSHSAIKLF